MIGITLDRNRIEEKIKRNTHSINGINYTYDNIYDILRVGVRNNTPTSGVEKGHVYIQRDKKGKLVTVEIQDFIDEFSPSEYKSVLQDRKALSALNKIYSEITNDQD